MKLNTFFVNFLRIVWLLAAVAGLLLTSHFADILASKGPYGIIILPMILLYVIGVGLVSDLMGRLLTPHRTERIINKK